MPDVTDDLNPVLPSDSHSVDGPGEPERDPSDTQPVPPPNFRERLLAAQRARSHKIGPSVEIPTPGSRPATVKDAFDLLDKSKSSEADAPGAPLTAADQGLETESDQDSLNPPLKK